MVIARRRFLTALLVATGGAAAAAVGFRGPLKGVYHRLKDPVLNETPTGPISEQILNTLLAATQAFVGYPIETGHYADFFRWHSETLRGYKTLYERFTATLNRVARESRGCDFSECNTTMRQKILEPAFRVHRARSKLDQLRFAVIERDWRLFDLFIFRPIAELFANTDAWPLVGYDAWPGIPRGLQRYTQPPGKVQ